MDATILRTGCRCQTPVRFVHLHPPELIRLRKISGKASAYHACLWTAPSITTQAVTYRQIANRSFRARATIAVLRCRPPLRSTRALNHRVNADFG
jgi:hypothetical protein